jgi:formylglycine-generating enzyme required for sulfatase activity
MRVSLEQPMPNRQLRVLLCHSSLDKPAVRKLYHRLRADGFAPRLDEEELLPGPDGRWEIPPVISADDIVIVCLSHMSASSDTYLQREVREVLYVASKKLAGTIWVIPARLDEVEVPKSLSQWHWPDVSQETSYQELVWALTVHARAIGATVADDEASVSVEAPKPVATDELRLPVEAPELLATDEARVPVEGPEPVSLGSVEQETRTILATMQLRTNSKGKRPQIVAVPLVCAAVVVIVGVLAWIYWPKPPRPQSGAGERLSARTEPVIIPQQAGRVSRANGIQVRADAKDGLKYVWIPPGTFKMGCSPRDNGCRGSEKPPHTVTLSKGFWIGQTEVTVAAYKRFAEATGHQMPYGPYFHGAWVNGNMPIVYVSWNDAHDYCTWAGGRLPTEAEWEYAGRGGNAEPHCGNLDEIAWSENNSGSHPHEVAQKRANGFGLYDTLGNVIEWVNDWYDQYYYQASSEESVGH